MTIVAGSDFEFADLPGRRSADPLRDVDAAASLRVVDLERTEGRAAHRHPYSEEVVYVAAGHGSVWIDGTTHSVRQGDVVHVPVGAAHATIPTPGVEMRLICFFPHPDLSHNIEDTSTQVT